MGVGIVATLTVKADKAAEFETNFKELMAIVADKEPGNNYYTLHRSLTWSWSSMLIRRHLTCTANQMSLKPRAQSWVAVLLVRQSSSCLIRSNRTLD